LRQAIVRRTGADSALQEAGEGFPPFAPFPPEISWHRWDAPQAGK
jgi:hypothetical protein